MSTIEETAESVAIELIVSSNPGIVLVDKKKRADFIAHVKAEVESFEHDMSTEAGRKRTASLAYKVTRSKTAIDEAGAELKSDWLKKSQAVDAERRVIREQFDALRDQARKPLTEWESAESARKAKAHEITETLNSAAVVPISATVESCKATLEAIRILDTSEAALLEFSAQATEAKKLAYQSLSAAIVRIEREEKDRAELVILRAEQERRIAAEAEAARLAEADRLQKERDERARGIEEKRIADEKDRIERARADAEAVAIAKEQRLAREAAEKMASDHSAEVAKLRAEADKRDAEQRAEFQAARHQQREAQAKHDAEMNRLAQIEMDRKAAEARQKAIDEAKAKADRKLAADKKHRAALRGAAMMRFQELAEITPDQSAILVDAIMAGEVDNITLRLV